MASTSFQRRKATIPLKASLGIQKILVVFISFHLAFPQNGENQLIEEEIKHVNGVFWCVSNFKQRYPPLY